MLLDAQGNPIDREIYERLDSRIKSIMYVSLARPDKEDIKIRLVGDANKIQSIADPEFLEQVLIQVMETEKAVGNPLKELGFSSQGEQFTYTRSKEDGISIYCLDEPSNTDG